MPQWLREVKGNTNVIRNSTAFSGFHVVNIWYMARALDRCHGVIQRRQLLLRCQVSLHAVIRQSMCKYFQRITAMHFSCLSSLWMPPTNVAQRGCMHIFRWQCPQKMHCNNIDYQQHAKPLVMIIIGRFCCLFFYYILK